MGDSDVTVGPIADDGVDDPGLNLTITADGGATFSTIDLNGTTTDGNLTITVDDDADSPETLAMNGGVTNVNDVTLEGDGAAAGGDTIDVNASLTAGGFITIQGAQNVDFASGITLDAQGGNLDVDNNVGNITLSGGGLITLQTTVGDNDVNLDDIIATGNEDLTITSTRDVNLLTVTLGTGNLDVTVDSDDDSGVRTLLVNGIISAGDIRLAGGTGGGDGSDDTIDIDQSLDATVGAINIENAGNVEIGSFTLDAGNGDINIDNNVDAIVLDGAGVGTVTLQTTGITNEDSINLVNVTATGFDENLTITSVGSVTLTTVELGNTGILDIDIDSDNDSVESLTAGQLDAGNITISGMNGDDSAILNGNVTSDTTQVAIDNLDTVDVNGDISAAVNLNITNVTTEVDIATGLTLSATAGNVDISTGVGQIDFSSTTGGTNTITAAAGNVTLASVIDSGTGPADVNVTAGNTANLVAITLDGTAGGNNFTGNATTINVDGNIDITGSGNLIGSSILSADIRADSGIELDTVTVDVATVILDTDDTGGADVNVTGNIDSDAGQNRNLDVQATGGNVTFGDDIGTTSRLGSLTVAATQANLNGANILVNGGGNVDFTNASAVVLSSNLLIDSDAAGGDILFGNAGANTMNGNFDLDIVTSSDGAAAGAVSLDAVGQAPGAKLNTLDITAEGTAAAAGGAITLNGNISTNGAITIDNDNNDATAAGNITVAVNIDTNNGNITIQADNDFTQNAGTIEAGLAGGANDGNIGIRAREGSIVINDLVATSDDVLLTANGSISDQTNTGNLDASDAITADQTALRAGTGINNINTMVNTLAATSGTGNIQIYNDRNTADFTIGDVNDLDAVLISGVSLTGGAGGGGQIVIQSGSPLIENSDVTSSTGADISLSADGGTLGDTIAINANVTTTGGNGNIELVGGGNITIGGGASRTISTAGTGTISVLSGFDYAGTPFGAHTANTAGNADIAMNNDSEITTPGVGGTTTATLTATGDVNLGRVVAGTGDATVTADNDDTGGGAITDNFGGEGVDQENVVGNVVTLRATTGIGSGGNIDIQAVTLDALNNGNGASGNIEITESDNVALDQVNNTTARDVTLFALAGNITDFGDANKDVVAATATIRTDSGFGQTPGTGNAAIETTIGIIDLINATSQIVNIAEDDDLAIEQITSPNDIYLTAGGNVTDNTNGGTDVDTGRFFIDAASVGESGGNGSLDIRVVRLEAHINNGDIFISEEAGGGDLILEDWFLVAAGDANADGNAITSGGGLIDIDTAAGTITQNDDVLSTGGNISVVAVGGNLTMTDGTQTLSANGNVAYSADGNVDLSIIDGGSGSTVTVTADLDGGGVGAITDNTAAEGAGVGINVTADDALLLAGSGIGDDANAVQDIDTDLVRLDARTVTGDIFIRDTGDGVELADLDATNGAVAITTGGAGDNITIIAASPMTVSNIVTNFGAGDVTLIAAGGTAADTLTANANVTASGGSVELRAGGTVTVSTTGAGNVNVFAGRTEAGAAGSGDANADVDMQVAAGNATISIGTGTASVEAPDDVLLATVTGGVGSTVNVTADSDSTNDGDIVDNNTGSTNITATNANLIAGQKIGDLSDAAPAIDEANADFIEIAITNLTAEVRTESGAGVGEIALRDVRANGAADFVVTGLITPNDVTSGNIGSIWIVSDNNSIDATGVAFSTGNIVDGNDNLALQAGPVRLEAANGDVGQGAAMGFLGNIDSLTAGNFILKSGTSETLTNMNASNADIAILGDTNFLDYTQTGNGNVDVTDDGVNFRDIEGDGFSITTDSGNVDIPVTSSGSVLTVFNNVDLNIREQAVPATDGGDLNIEVQSIARGGASDGLAGNVSNDNDGRVLIDVSAFVTTDGFDFVGAGNISVIGAVQIDGIVEVRLNDTITLRGPSNNIIINTGQVFANEAVFDTGGDDFVLHVTNTGFVIAGSFIDITAGGVYIEEYTGPANPANPFNASLHAGTDVIITTLGDVSPINSDVINGFFAEPKARILAGNDITLDIESGDVFTGTMNADFDLFGDSNGNGDISIRARGSGVAGFMPPFPVPPNTGNLDANTGDIVINGSLTAGGPGTTNSVILESQGGSVRDDSMAASDITTNTLIISAFNGIGDDPTAGANPFETMVSNISATTGSGDLLIENDGAMKIVNSSATMLPSGGNAPNGLTITGGTGGLLATIASSPLTINAMVNNMAGGNIIQVAAGNDAGVLDTLTINAPVTASGAAGADTGNIYLYASGAILQNAGGVVTNNNADGNIVFGAGVDYFGGALGNPLADLQKSEDVGVGETGFGNLDITQAIGTSTLNAGAGDITYLAADDITVFSGGISAANGVVALIASYDGSGNVNVLDNDGNAIFGAEVWADSTTTDIDPNNTGRIIDGDDDAVTDIVGATVKLGAGSGIGFTDGQLGNNSAIDINAGILLVENTDSSDVEILEADNVALFDLRNLTRTIALEAGGAITDGNDGSTILQSDTARLRAQDGIGEAPNAGADDLQIDVDSLFADNLTSGVINIADTDSVALIQVNNLARDVYLAASSGNITDFLNDGVADIQANRVFLDAIGVGEAPATGNEAIDTDIGTLEGHVTTGGLYIVELAAGGNLTLADWHTAAVGGDPAPGTDTEAISTTTGNVRIETLDGSILQGTAAIDGDIVSNTGNVTLIANDTANTGDITMFDGVTTFIDGAAGDSAVNYQADNDIDLSIIDTTGGGNLNIMLTADLDGDGVGAITDNLTAENAAGVNTLANTNLRGVNLTIVAATGVGSGVNGDATDIDTAVANLDVRNTTANNINIDEIDTLTVTRALQDDGAGIFIVSGDTMTIPSAGSGVVIDAGTTAAGDFDIFLQAETNNVEINDEIRNDSTFATADVTVIANVDVNLNESPAGVSIQTGGGTIFVTAQTGNVDTSVGNMDTDFVAGNGIEISAGIDAILADDLTAQTYIDILAGDDVFVDGRDGTDDSTLMTTTSSIYIRANNDGVLANDVDAGEEFSGGNVLINFADFGVTFDANDPADGVTWIGGENIFVFGNAPNEPAFAGRTTDATFNLEGSDADGDVIPTFGALGGFEFALALVASENIGTANVPIVAQGTLASGSFVAIADEDLREIGNAAFSHTPGNGTRLDFTPDVAGPSNVGTVQVSGDSGLKSGLDIINISPDPIFLNVDYTAPGDIIIISTQNFIFANVDINLLSGADGDPATSGDIILIADQDITISDGVSIDASNDLIIRAGDNTALTSAAGTGSALDTGRLTIGDGVNMSTDFGSIVLEANGNTTVGDGEIIIGTSGAAAGPNIVANDDLIINADSLIEVHGTLRPSGGFLYAQTGSTGEYNGKFTIGNKGVLDLDNGGLTVGNTDVAGNAGEEDFSTSFEVLDTVANPFNNTFIVPGGGNAIEFVNDDDDVNTPEFTNLGRAVVSGSVLINMSGIEGNIDFGPASGSIEADDDLTIIADASSNSDIIGQLDVVADTITLQALNTDGDISVDDLEARESILIEAGDNIVTGSLEARENAATGLPSKSQRTRTRRLTAWVT